MKDYSDTKQLLKRIDLQNVITAELGRPNGSGMWHCPFHDDKNPSLGIVKNKPHLWHCFGCGKTGDAISFLCKHHNMSFKEAFRSLTDNEELPKQANIARPHRRRIAQAQQPGSTWSDMAERVCVDAEQTLWTNTGKPGRDYLRRRGISETTARNWRLGWNEQDQFFPPQQWGLFRDHKKVWIPCGILVPWRIDGRVWRVNVRRFNPSRGPKYCSPAGFKQGLFNADALSTEHPAILVESEFDVMLIDQVAGDLVTPVATGSATGSRVAKWIYRLSACPMVLLSFDRDNAGDKAAEWWQKKLSNSHRWLPLGKDPGDMQQEFLYKWVCAALGITPAQPKQMPGAPQSSSQDWWKRFSEDQLERFAIRTMQGGMDDTEALKAEGLIP